MARPARLYAPRVPQLAQALFAHPLADPAQSAPTAQLNRLRGWLTLESTQHGLALHAWAITPDRVALLASPADIHQLSQVIQGLGRRMAGGLLHGRVFVGRYHNALLEPGRWVLPAMVWLESLPARLGYVDDAEHWPWSSARAHVGLQPDAMLVDHADYWGEGNTPFSRQAAYRQRLATGLDTARNAQIEAAIRGQWALGEKIFLAHLGRLASRAVVAAPRGRPRKDVAGR